MYFSHKEPSNVPFFYRSTQSRSAITKALYFCGTKVSQVWSS